MARVSCSGAATEIGSGVVTARAARAAAMAEVGSVTATDVAELVLIRPIRRSIWSSAASAELPESSGGLMPLLSSRQAMVAEEPETPSGCDFFSGCWSVVGIARIVRENAVAFLLALGI